MKKRNSVTSADYFAAEHSVLESSIKDFMIFETYLSFFIIMAIFQENLGSFKLTSFILSELNLLSIGFGSMATP